MGCGTDYKTHNLVLFRKNFLDKHNKTCECEFKLKTESNKLENRFSKKDVITRTRQGPLVSDGSGTMPAFAKGTSASAGSISDTS